MLQRVRGFLRGKGRPRLQRGKNLFQASLPLLPCGKPAPDVAAAGDRGKIVKAAKDAFLRQALDCAKGKRGAANASAGDAQGAYRSGRLAGRFAGTDGLALCSSDFVKGEWRVEGFGLEHARRLCTRSEGKVNFQPRSRFGNRLPCERRCSPTVSTAQLPSRSRSVHAY